MSARNPNLAIRRHPLALLEEPERIRATRRGEIVHHALDALGGPGGPRQAGAPAGRPSEQEIERAVTQAFAILDLDRAGWDIEQDFTRPIARAFGLPQFSGWFDPSARSLREAEILDADGRVLRPDRVIIGSDRIEVVDFKAGRREDDHREQVATYVALLEAIFEGRPVEGYLVYIDEPAVVKVR
ncbi:MAG: PD-(D/E)XK nuclease family protein [bacterium]